MKVTLGTSTGARIDVRQEQDIFHARRADQLGEPQTCLGVDLFEVIAELAQLDLDHEAHAAEAIRLAERAKDRLAPVAAGSSSACRAPPCGRLSVGVAPRAYSRRTSGEECQA